MSAQETKRNDDNNDDDLLLQQCLQLVQDRGIKVCVFDMDQTAVAQHSRGRLKRGGPLQAYLSKTTRDFKNLVPLLYHADIGLAIATHSDEAEFGYLVKPETHILGSELARAVLDANFTQDISNAFQIVAYNPRARRGTHHGGELEENALKRYHFRILINHFQVEPNEILFFDDAKSIVEDCCNVCGVRAIAVSPRVGFELQDLLKNL